MGHRGRTHPGSPDSDEAREHLGRAARLGRAGTGPVLSVQRRLLCDASGGLGTGVLSGAPGRGHRPIPAPRRHEAVATPGAVHAGDPGPDGPRPRHPAVLRAARSSAVEPRGPGPVDRGIGLDQDPPDRRVLQAYLRLQLPGDGRPAGRRLQGQPKPRHRSARAPDVHLGRGVARDGRSLDSERVQPDLPV